MDTHIKFKAKEYSTVAKGVNYIKKHPTLPLVAGSLAVGTANLATNRSRHDKDRKYQEQQLQAMNSLTESIKKLDKNVKSVNFNNQKPEENKKSTFSIKRILKSNK